MVTAVLLLKLLALVFFIVAALPVSSRINLLAVGLACWVASGLVP